jgi:uncharacterized protein
MPNTWIKRDIQDFLDPLTPQLQSFPIWLILGPRQVGKSSVLKQCGPERQYINLDDLQTRERATRDPVLFLKDLNPPLIIDEIQYAPKLLSGLKILADSGLSAGSIWLTGSQNFEVMAGVQETLAGRVAILPLLGLSDFEKNEFEKNKIAQSPQKYFEQIVESSFPKLFQTKNSETLSLYFSSYVQTYIERDVRELLGIQKRREFEVFLKIAALRTGQIVNYDDFSRDVGVSAKTIKEWLSLLQDSFVIKLVHPYFSNRTKRLIKSPKLYFLDMGLAAYLAGWRDPEMLRLGPMSGAAFETHIFGQLLRHFGNQIREVQIHFWRTRDDDEIDFLIETQGKIYPLEAKLGNPKVSELLDLGKIRDPNWQHGMVVSLTGPETGSSALTAHWNLVSPGGMLRGLSA